MKLVPKPDEPGLNPPPTLSKSAKELWRQILAEYAISDAAGLSILATGLHAWDRAAEARQAIARDGLMIGRPPKPHPLLRVERDSQAQFLVALRHLNLDLEPLRDGPGRPAGSF